MKNRKQSSPALVGGNQYKNRGNSKRALSNLLVGKKRIKEKTRKGSEMEQLWKKWENGDKGREEEEGDECIEKDDDDDDCQQSLRSLSTLWREKVTKK